MTFTDVVILLVVFSLLSLIVYFQFIKNRGKGACASCSNKKSSFVKEYYKSKCEGNNI